MSHNKTTITSQDVDRLLGIIDDQKQQIQALRIRIAFLEKRMEQREVATVNFYQEKKIYFPEMQRKVMQIFLGLPATVGLTYPEILDEWKRKFPRVNYKNVPRRVRELVNQGKLWSNPDPDGTARFYLKLRE